MDYGKRFIEKSNGTHHHKYDYSKSIYVSAHTKTTIICSVHGEFLQKPNDHMNGSGCPKCVGKYRPTTEEFIDKAKLIHNDIFEYLKVKYKNINTKIIIICKIHGEFGQTPNSHLAGNGCPKCSSNNKLTNEIFIEKANIIHNNRYDYSKTKYKNRFIKVVIICGTHGEFKQTPKIHLKGSGCSNCGLEIVRTHLKSNTLEFIQKAIVIHGIKYNYSKIKYNGNKNKVIIICNTHGEFLQTPHEHLNKNGCPKCSRNVSNMETEWINSFNDKNISTQVKLNVNNKIILVDGFDKITNTVYEFNGDLWHGNPKVFKPDQINRATKTYNGYLYKKTIEKENLIKSAGYKLITMWEYDWVRRKGIK